MSFITVEDAIERIRTGDIIVVVDDEDRENEGDVTMAAELVNAESINFMIKYGRGLVCMPCDPARLAQLHIEPMVATNTSSHETAFTVTIDHRSNTTGISAEERAVTIRKVVDSSSRSTDFIRPGHVFPLRAKEGGVLRRAGHTEASVDLARLAGLAPVAVICEILNDDGTTARLPDLEKFAEIHNLGILSIAQLIAYRRQRETLIQRTSEARLPTEFGTFRAVSFESHVDGRTHVALVAGEPAGRDNVLVRVHSECFTGDVIGSLRCDCREQLAQSLRMIAADGTGVVVYIRGHEGRGIGLRHKLEAYQLQDEGMDTVQANEHLGFPADSRDYGIGAQILRDLGVTTMRYMTNNPAKRAGLEGYGLRIAEQVPIETTPNEHNIDYLRAKRDKLGHELNDLDETPDPEKK